MIDFLNKKLKQKSHLNYCKENLMINFLLSISTKDIARVWANGSKGFVPENAIEGGHEGAEISYIGRAFHGGDVVPGQFPYIFYRETVKSTPLFITFYTATCFYINKEKYVNFFLK